MSILTIGGSDSSGGAGIQADIKTVSRLGAHCLVAVTAVTAQNSVGVHSVHKVPARHISSQLEAILDDLMPDAVKIGMLYSLEAVKLVAGFLKNYDLPHVVMDPVFRASTGRRLLEKEAASVLKDDLLPLTDVVTPNLDEARTLIGGKVEDVEEAADAARIIKTMGPDVVVTGGHMKERCVDILYNGKEIHMFSGSRIDTNHDHGTGCVFSTAMAVYLARGQDIVTATKMAHEFTRNAIISGYACGKGAGPVNPEWGSVTTKV